LVEHIVKLLDEIQQNLFNRSVDFRKGKTHVADDYETFKRLLDKEGGFVSAHWDGSAETEERIKSETKATIRCIPLDGKIEAGKCILTGNPSKRRVLFAKAY
jgi:prolyl-tRNA synthetase